MLLSWSAAAAARWPLRVLPRSNLGTARLVLGPVLGLALLRAVTHAAAARAAAQLVGTSGIFFAQVPTMAPAPPPLPQIHSRACPAMPSTRRLRRSLGSPAAALASLSACRCCTVEAREPSAACTCSTMDCSCGTTMCGWVGGCGVWGVGVWGVGGGCCRCCCCVGVGGGVGGGGGGGRQHCESRLVAAAARHGSAECLKGWPTFLQNVGSTECRRPAAPGPRC